MVSSTFVATIVKFEDDGVWLSPKVNNRTLHSPTEYVEDENGLIVGVRASNVEFNDKGEFKLPYESPRVITPIIPLYERNDDNVGKFCLYISGIFNNPNDSNSEVFKEYIAVEIGDDAFELSSKWR